MELRHLRYFVAAAEELNISRAAARLHLSQPPLSRQIRALEHEIGTPLFDRRNKNLRLTASGVYFLAEAKKILSQANRAARLAKSAANGDAQQIVIAFLSPLGGTFLPRVIRSFRQKFPSVDVDLREMAPKHQLEGILDHHVDLGFVASAEVESTSDLAFKSLTKVQLRLALAPDHRLAKVRRIPLASLGEERFVIFKRSSAPATHDFILGVCRAVGFEPNVVKQADRAQSILDLVAAGAGISIVPEPFRRYRVDLRFRPLTPTPPALSLSMVWRQNDHSLALRALRTMILHHFGVAST